MADISVIKVGTTDYTIKDAQARADLLTKAPLASPSFTGTPLVPTPDINTDNTQIANTAWVNDRIDAAIATSDAMIFKGTIGKEGATITTKTLPNNTAKTGWTYKAVEAGNYTVGTGTGTGTTTVKCEVGDMIIALSNGSSSTYATWVVVQANIDGAVTGPASATANHIATFDGTSGKIIKDSGFTIATSVPENAVFTDTHVTAVGNHYTPTGTTTKSASGATGTSGATVQVVTGVTMDAAGHVTAVTSGAATDTKNTVGSSVTTDKIYFVGVKTYGGTSQTSYATDEVYVEGDTMFAGKLTVGAGGLTTDGIYSTASGTFEGTVTCEAIDVSGDIDVTGGSISVEGTAVSLEGHTHSFSGTTKKFAFSGTAGSATASYTPAGTISKPNVTVTPSTTTVNSITAIGSLPSWSASVTDETLSFSFSAGTLPTKGANTTVMTGVSAALASTPAFTGTAATITSSYTPAGTIAINASTGSGTSYTPEGTVG